VHFFLLPVWLLALPVIWLRSAKLPSFHRIAMLVCITISIFALAEGLTHWIIVGKLAGLDAPLALHHQHVHHVASSVAFGISVTSFIMFLWLAIRGSLAVKQRQRSNQIR